MKTINKIIASVSAFGILTLPALITFAETPKTFKDLIENTIIGGLLRPIVPLLVSLAVVLFLYGVILKIFSEGGEKAEEGKQYMFWGIVGIFVMVSVWGLVAVLDDTFDLNNQPRKIQIKIPTP